MDSLNKVYQQGCLWKGSGICMMKFVSFVTNARWIWFALNLTSPKIVTVSTYRLICIVQLSSNKWYSCSKNNLNFITASKSTTVEDTESPSTSAPPSKKSRKKNRELSCRHLPTLRPCGFSR